ncbi:MAG: histidinol dehydrogenase [Acidimicrobiia bacterium]|nr:histidinol dehydrogenase [Acidimicrobiia bacterium]MYC57186.1 histidinol dehydrogenase [Acidimicrobiia bacterium]MYG93887.1 histidinol dehydrogenase [Acidimicrobiia bacterium]MYI29890.1 histidinol dehydrogenase [Acidimicrobiia bacterium]
MVLKRVDLRGVVDFADLLPRPEPVSQDVAVAVRQILNDVADEGDAALLRYTQQLDGVSLDSLRVQDGDVDAALGRIAPELRVALEVAADAIEEFHRHQIVAEHTSHRGGISIRSWYQPVGRAGCYAPGGKAAYPSTVLMTVLPARVAGVDQVALCVPPSADGCVADATLAAGAIAGVDEVYAVGGAQAIAAMAYGTESIAPTDVIVGPGNVYVASAKQCVAGTVGVPDSFAGPSEVVVVADASTQATYGAADLMAQAEHGPDGSCWLITWDSQVVDAIEAALVELIADAARKEDIVATFEHSGHAVLVDDAQAAAKVVNHIAPEHLQVMIADPRAVIGRIKNAGAIFNGPLAPTAVGDYVAGPSHVLPTSGSARFGGVLSVRDFVKPMHEVSISQQGMATFGPHAAALADAEGLAAHAQSIRMRLVDADRSVDD